MRAVQAVRDGKSESVVAQEMFESCTPRVALQQKVLFEVEGDGFDVWLADSKQTCVDVFLDKRSGHF